MVMAEAMVLVMVAASVEGTVVADMVEVEDTVVAAGTVVVAGMVEVMVEDPEALAILEVDISGDHNGWHQGNKNICICVPNMNVC